MQILCLKPRMDNGTTTVKDLSLTLKFSLINAKSWTTPSLRNAHFRIHKFEDPGSGTPNPQGFCALQKVSMGSARGICKYVFAMNE